MTAKAKKALLAELRDDPLGRGYADMSDVQATTSLNTRNRRTEDRRPITRARELGIGHVSIRLYHQQIAQAENPDG